MSDRGPIASAYCTDHAREEIKAKSLRTRLLHPSARFAFEVIQGPHTQPMTTKPNSLGQCSRRAYLSGPFNLPSNNVSKPKTILTKKASAELAMKHVLSNCTTGPVQRKTLGPVLPEPMYSRLDTLTVPAMTRTFGCVFS